MVGDRGRRGREYDPIGCGKGTEKIQQDEDSRVL